MGTLLVVIFAAIFGTAVLSILMVMVHEIIKWWFNEAHNSDIYIEELNKKKVYIIVGVSLWIVLTLLVIGMKNS